MAQDSHPTAYRTSMAAQQMAKHSISRYIYYPNHEEALYLNVTHRESSPSWTESTPTMDLQGPQTSLGPGTRTSAHRGYKTQAKPKDFVLSVLMSL